MGDSADGPTPRPLPELRRRAPCRRPRRPLPALPAPRRGSTAAPRALCARRTSSDATVDCSGTPASWRRSPRPSARCRASCSATPTPVSRAARSSGPPDRPAAGRPPAATASSARSPAAAWAPCSRAATPTSAATWPSRSCCEAHRDNARAGPPVRRGGADRRPAPAPGHRAGLRAGHLRRPPAVLHHEAGQGPDPGRPAGRPAGAGRRPAAVPGDLRAGLPDGGLRPRPRRDPPRPEAVERHGRHLRRGAGDGLGPGQGPAPRRRRRRRRGRQDAASRRRSSPRPGAARTTRTSRRPARCWARRPTWPPSRPGARSSAVDERADVFALGSILCEILTGQPAFAGRSSGEIQRKAARGDLADALARLDACGADAELIALAKDCLAPEPEDRPRDAGAVAERLDGLPGRRAGAAARGRAGPGGGECAGRGGEADGGGGRARAGAERRARRLTAGLAASVLALVALGGGGYSWMQQQAPSGSPRRRGPSTRRWPRRSAHQGEARAAGDDRRNGPRRWPRWIGRVTW